MLTQSVVSGRMKSLAPHVAKRNRLQRMTTLSKEKTEIGNRLLAFTKHKYKTNPKKV